jgi:predicted Zn finger-like uncharacterized protein
MRLVCPNCGAQYEVPDDVIPRSGRDVQCSNCGNTWFQVHPEQDAGLTEELEAQDDVAPAATQENTGAGAVTAPEVDENDASDTPPPEPAISAPHQHEDGDPEDMLPEPDVPGAMPEWDAGGDGVNASQVPAPPVEEYEDDYETWEDTPPAPRPETTKDRRPLDPDVADLLREEAEREARQRASERETLESQPDLGLSSSDEDEAARRQREAQERMARLRGAPVPETDPQSGAEEAASAASRRDLLPDIDEINSTLRATNQRRPAAAGDHDRPGDAAEAATDAEVSGGGFRRGFLFVVLLMVIAVLLYVYAPRLAETVPALQGVLSSYVEVMDGLRLWIDDKLRGVLQWLDSMSGQS